MKYKFSNLNFGAKLSFITMSLILSVSLPLLFLIYQYLDSNISELSKNIYTDNSKNLSDKISFQFNEISRDAFDINEILLANDYFNEKVFQSLNQNISEILANNNNISGLWIELNPEEIKTTDNLSNILYTSDISKKH